ncbi:unnamed protein product [Cercospora beticola]|nr:unnamed protein product [Cercospora beticola]
MFSQFFISVYFPLRLARSRRTMDLMGTYVGGQPFCPSPAMSKSRACASEELRLCEAIILERSPFFRVFTKIHREKSRSYKTRKQAHSFQSARTDRLQLHR